MKKLLKAFGVIVGLIGALYVAAFLILGALASKTEKAADEQWRAAGQPTLAELEKRWPDSADNPAALELEKRAAALGLSLAPPSLKRNPPSPESKAAIDGAVEWKGADGKAVKLAEWLNGTLSNPPGDAAAFPAPLAGWLDANKAGLDAVIDHLGGSEPAWGCRLTFDAPLIDMAGVSTLHRVLLARATRELQSGDGAGADRTLASAWRLGDALARNPPLIYAIIRAGMRRQQLALLRALPAPGAEWAARVEAERAADSRGDLLSVEGRMLSLHTRRLKGKTTGALFGDEAGATNILLRPLAVPYLRYAGAEMSRLSGISAEAIRNPAAMSKFKAGGDPTREGSWLVRPILSMAVPNYDKMFGKLERARLEAEMTGHALALRAARAASGKWPESLSDGASKIAAGETWNWTPDGAGGGTLSISHAPKWEESGALVVSLEWKPAG